MRLITSETRPRIDTTRLPRRRLASHCFCFRRRQFTTAQGDLAALLALFIGARAWTLNDEQRARYVVRRSHSIAGTLDDVPDVGIPEWLEVGDDAATLAEIMALPPPVPPSDSGDGGALLAHGLVRQWASSCGALRAALRRQLERGAALESALESGQPTYISRDPCLVRWRRCRPARVPRTGHGRENGSSKTFCPRCVLMPPLCEP